MKANWLPLSAAVALALSSVTASAVDFHGYARAGAQANTQGGEVYCLGKTVPQAIRLVVLVMNAILMLNSFLTRKFTTRLITSGL